MHTVPPCFYRISIKALILDEENRFLLTKESCGKWEFPGGGLDFGEEPLGCLAREIYEETGLTATHISDRPSYFITTKSTQGHWIANVLYRTSLEHTNFTASDECIEMRFFTKQEALKENLFSNVTQFAQMYDPENHK